MSPLEIAVRLRQECDKRLDEVRHRVGLAAAAQPLLDQRPPAGRFFFDPGDLPALVDLLRSRLPEQAASIISQAERICRRRFDLLGYEDLDFGDPIDWHLDPVHGRRGPRIPWFHVPFLRFATVGDHKIIWELNRHQHLVTLAKAFLLSDDSRFLDELHAQWYAWQESNPYPLGINWASSLEVAFRSLSWIWVTRLLAGCGSVPEKFRGDVASALSANARHIEKYLSTYWAPNTHLLGEGLALLFIGTLCNEFASAERWRRRGWEIVLNESRRQVLPDGMHFEQSIYYHVYALDFFLHARVLAARNGEAVPPELDATIERMAEALRVQSQAGAAPRFGDDDGGRLFDPRRNRTEHLLDPLATAAALYSRADFKAAAGGFREETLWLLGAQGAAHFDELPAERPAPASGCCTDSGTYCLIATEPPIREVVIDAGPHGYGHGGHGHADALSLQWIARRREWLSDPGAFSYSQEIPRNQFRGTAAHNTLEVDGLDQAEPTEPFAWHAKPEARVERWLSSPDIDLFIGSHNGYSRLADPVRHRRSVVSWKSGLLLVRDCATGAAVHELALNWHLGPGFRLSHEGRGLRTFAGPDGAALSFACAAVPDWTSAVVDGEWSPVYGSKIGAPVVQYRARVLLPAEFAVMLSPAAPAWAALERLPDASGPLSVYRYADPADSLLILFSDGAGEWQWHDWMGDAAFLSLGRRAGEPWLFAAGVGRLQFRGQPLLASGQALEFWEASGAGVPAASLADLG
ncbi:MAG: alginate lyase family protein [Bryobacteraceae bacterium]